MSSIHYKGFFIHSRKDGKFYIYFPINLCVSDKKEFQSLLAGKQAITKFLNSVKEATPCQ